MLWKILDGLYDKGLDNARKMPEIAQVTLQTDNTRGMNIY